MFINTYYLHLALIRSVRILYTLHYTPDSFVFHPHLRHLSIPVNVFKNNREIITSMKFFMNINAVSFMLVTVTYFVYLYLQF